MHFHVLNLCNLAVLCHHPELFKYFLELLFVGHREDFLRCNFPVVQFDPAIAEARDYRVVRDHHNRAPFAVEVT